MTVQTGLPTRKIKVLFIGGSNTVMKNGYSAETIRALGEYFDLERVDNLAIGGTSVGMGLWTTLNFDPSCHYDLVFVEYTVNDYGYSKDPAAFDAWRWALQALLGHLRRRFPRAAIHTLIFGRRGKHLDPRQRALVDATLEISAACHAHPIMVDAYLHGLLPEGESDHGLFADRGHYKRPLVTSLAANYISRVVVACDRRAQGHALAPVTPSPVQHADHRLFAPLGEVRDFRNSLYQLRAVALEVGGPWQEITIPGELVQLNYISTRESARIIVAEDAESPVAFDTLHKRTDNGEFAFLIRNLMFNWKGRPAGATGPRRLAVRAVASKAIKGQDFRYIEQYNMLGPRSAEQNKVVYLSGALFA
jgi:hypothetical protein